MDTILITGATGQVGTALVTRLLQQQDTHVLALVRARDAADLQARLERLRAACGDVDTTRLTAVAGDVGQPNLGLSSDDDTTVRERVTSMIHAAAAVRFDLPAKDAAQANLNATTHVLELAQRLKAQGTLRRLDHISTAYVAGTHRGRFHEHDHNVGQSFRNTYEWSKHQAELRVHHARNEGLPVAIHRPSIIVGESGSGRTRAFNVLYWPLKVYTRGWWRTFPGSPEARVDIVPVDYVAGTLALLRQDPSTLGKTFHLAAGDDARTVQELASHITRTTGGPPVRYVNQHLYRRWVRPLLTPFLSVSRRGRAIMRGGEAYMPYFLHNPVFDTSNTVGALGAAGRPPPILEYLDRVLGYAVQENFGER